MRRCGSCDVCCTILGVDPLEKPKGVKCKHAKTNGTKRCTIYKDRPEECQTFECLWIRGLGSTKDRPDRSGIMFFVSDSTMGEAIVASEVWFDAGNQTRARTAMAAGRRVAEKLGTNFFHRRWDKGEQT